MKYALGSARIPRPLAACLLLVLPGCLLQHASGPTPSTTLESNPALVGRKLNGTGLTIEMKATPDPVKLGETREINVTLVLRNKSKQPVDLKFATSQTIEILLRDPDNGKVLSQWSSDRTFEAISRYLVVNPRERVEYNEPITTRELHAGKTYTLEAYCVGYDQQLRASRQITPQP